MKDLIIIGGGAAGITASIYASRKYIDSILIAKDFTGQVGTSAWIENYPGFQRVSGLELIQNFKKHLDSVKNIEIKSFETVEEIKKNPNSFIVSTDEGFYQSRAIIIATGCFPKKLAVENENKFLGKGVSYCATCDEAGFEDKIVAVIGGGNAGLESAIELSRFCQKVYIFESLANLSGDEILQIEAKKKSNIEIITGVKIERFEGKDSLEKIIYQEIASEKIKEMPVEGCFIEIGRTANTAFLKNFLDLNEEGEIKVDPISLETSVAGCFAAGDITDLPGKQVVIACGQGASAVLSVQKYLIQKFPKNK